MTSIWPALATSFFVALILTPVCRWYARRRGALDVPGEASSHQVPTPRNGGIAIVIGLFAGAAVGGAFGSRAVAGILIAAFAGVVLAAIDELRTLSRVGRFVVQIAIAAALVVVALRPPVERFAVFVGVLMVLWLVGAINGFNFMDGLNGIASTAAIVSGVTIAVLAVRHNDLAAAALGVAIAGGAVGFLPWNLTGTIFMGDIGSATLGFLIAAADLQLIAIGVPPLAAMLPLLSFVSDAALAVIRRAAKGERFFATRHRSHFYQRLNQRGWSHPAVSSVWAGLMASAAAVAIAYESLSSTGRIVAVAAVVALHAVVFAAIAFRRAD